MSFIDGVRAGIRGIAAEDYPFPDDYDKMQSRKDFLRGLTIGQKVIDPEVGEDPPIVLLEPLVEPKIHWGSFILGLIAGASLFMLSMIVMVIQ